MFRLILYLPFGINIVTRTSYPDESTAATAAAVLPQGFQVIAEQDLSELKVIEVPFLKNGAAK